jgi:hypothetical protein
MAREQMAGLPVPNFCRPCGRINRPKILSLAHTRCDGSLSFLRRNERQINSKTATEQTTERVTVRRVKIDDEVICLDVVRRAEQRFVFEIRRDNGNRMVASSDEHKKAKRAARAGKPIWKRTVKAVLKEKLDQ